MLIDGDMRRPGLHKQMGRRTGSASRTCWSGRRVSATPFSGRREPNLYVITPGDAADPWNCCRPSA